MKEFVKSITSPYEKELIETRRYLHRHPELSFQETDTAAYIRSTLNALGVPLMEGISGTSTVAVIKGEKTGPCIAFRADIDALPVEEENDLPFKSEVPGVMHACGHDIHTAVLLTFAKVLTAHPELVRGTVKLIFQAAEEKLPGGAKALCEEGVMKDVDLIYGFHCASVVCWDGFEDFSGNMDRVRCRENGHMQNV